MTRDALLACIEELLKVEAEATPGPWDVWDGPEYVGGGRDLCIGAGEDWLANMDHRVCEAIHCHQGICGWPKNTAVLSGPSCSEEPCPAEEECKHSDGITAEQYANAALIVAARNSFRGMLELAKEQVEEHEPSAVAHVCFACDSEYVKHGDCPVLARWSEILGGGA